MHVNALKEPAAEGKCAAAACKALQELSRVRVHSWLPLPSVWSCLFQRFVTGAISTDLAVGLHLSPTASVPPVAH